MERRTLADILKQKGIATTDFVSRLKQAKIASFASGKKYTSWKEEADTLPAFVLPDLSAGESAEVRFDILPEYCSYPFAKRNTIQVQVEGLEMYCGVTYRMHYKVGPDEVNVVCLQSLSDPQVVCPVCELLAKAEETGSADSLKQWTPRYRSLLQIVLPDTPDRVMLFDFSFRSLYGKLLTAFGNLRFDDMPLSHLQNGVLPVRFHVVADANYLYVESPDDVEFLRDYTPSYSSDIILQTRDVADILRIIPPKWLAQYIAGKISVSDMLDAVRALEKKGISAVLDAVVEQSTSVSKKKHFVKALPKDTSASEVGGLQPEEGDKYNTAEGSEDSESLQSPADSSTDVKEISTDGVTGDSVIEDQSSSDADDDLDLADLDDLDLDDFDNLDALADDDLDLDSFTSEVSDITDIQSELED